MSRRSYKIYLVVAHDYEASKPLRAFTMKRDAQRFADTYVEEHYDRGNTVQQIDLLTHDGCHVLHEDLIKDRKQN